MVKKLYEAMFLVDSAEAAADWDGINAAVGNMLNDHLSGIEAYGFAPFSGHHHLFSTTRSLPPGAFSLL